MRQMYNIKLKEEKEKPTQTMLRLLFFCLCFPGSQIPPELGVHLLLVVLHFTCSLWINPQVEHPGLLALADVEVRESNHSRRL